MRIVLPTSESECRQYLVYQKWCQRIVPVDARTEKINPRINSSVFGHYCLHLLSNTFWRDFMMPKTPPICNQFQSR